MASKAQGRNQEGPWERKTILPTWKWSVIARNLQNIQTYQDEDPGPSWLSTNAIHFLDCGSKQPRKSARELGWISVPKTSDLRFYNAPKPPRKIRRFYMTNVRITNVRKTTFRRCVPKGQLPSCIKTRQIEDNSREHWTFNQTKKCPHSD